MRPGPAQPARRRLFLAVTLLLPWVALLLLEGALRLAGYGDSYPLFVRHPSQPAWLVASDRVAWRYFRGGAFLPDPETDFFLAEKPPNGLRLVFQGESSAQGFPYGHGAMPSRMLEQRLQEALPGRTVEAVNVALTAVASWTLLDQADEIVAQRPDAVLIYTGHNEYYGAFGAGSTRSVGRWRPAVKAYLMLRHSRAAQLLAAAVDALTPVPRGAGAGAPRTVMQLMAGEQRIPLGSPVYERGLAQFRANLSELLGRYRAHGIPVFIGTVASNERDQPPLAAADGPDPDSALAYFTRARRLEAEGDTTGARAAYREARERDALRFRAPDAVNAIIREEAARHGAVLVDTERALAAASPGGTVGGSLMLEHVHPNLDGYFLIADAFYRALRERRFGGEWRAHVPAEQARRAVPVTPLDSIVGVLRTDRLLSSWPFRPRNAERVPMVDTLRPRTEPERLARAVVLGQLPWPEATERLRDAAERAGDWETALRAARAMSHEYSWSPEPFMDAARASIRLGRHDDALRFVQGAIARRETPEAVQLAGLLQLRRGDHAAALPLLQRAAQLAPRDRRMTVPLQAAGLLPALERRRAAAPRDTVVLYELAAAYALTQQSARARETLDALLRVAPRHAAGRALLARLPRDST